MSARPQVGIERLPARRMSNEPRESMNCKSCRKRKIKCNRLRPTCEACQVFQCPCIYDAVPKKRGPKTDVLEALLKRVDGLEKRLKDEKKSNLSRSNEGESAAEKESPDSDAKPQRPQLDTITVIPETAVYSPISEPSPAAVQPDVLLDTYFTRCHGKAYHILDETSTRQRIQMNQIPSYLLYAIYAVSARYAAHPNGYHAAVRLSEDYSMRARSELDIDDPSIDCLQALLLLGVAFKAAGKGKKAYMMLASGIGMAMALEIHREFDHNTRATPAEREMRRRLFWTCYLMDRFTACGSKRPSLIADKSILLRLPCWSSNPGALPVEGEFFQSGSNLQYHSGAGKKSQGSSGMLIDIVRILGITNRYLAAGGVKGDSHFPWHSLSNLSKIRQDLDVWASGTQDVFSSVDALFGQPDSTTLVLSKLVYHLIHCLIYRPFLPINLAELAGTGQHQSWQIEATNLCFLHANAIAELVELGKQSSSIEWPAFVGYCICTAGTVHVHGTHYKSIPAPTSPSQPSVFSTSSDFLSREMQQLSELRYAWSSVQQQRETLQTIFACHAELVKSLTNNPMRYSPVFHLEDFFDRYIDLGMYFDGAHVSFCDITNEGSLREGYMGHDLYANGGNGSVISTDSTNSNTNGISTLTSTAKRKFSTTSTQRRKHLDLKLSHRNHRMKDSMISPNGTMSDGSLATNDQNMGTMHTHMETPMTPFSQSHPSNNNNGNMPNLTQTPFSPPSFNFITHTHNHNHNHLNHEAYDPMFGMGNMNFGHGYPSNAVTPNAHVANGTGNGNLMGEGRGESREGREGMTPGNESTGTNGEGEKDPFLSLLEQLAENEHSRGGPSDLDFFLGGGAG